MHKPVLLKEVVETLGLPPGGLLIDGTFGAGGHSLALAKSVDARITVIGLDRDGGAIRRGREMNFPGNLILEKADFAEADKILSKNGFSEADGVLLDLGFSSDQLEAGGRGFSFMADEPLLLTLDDSPTEEALTADRIINHWEIKNLETIIRNYGEEWRAGKIVRAIERARSKHQIKTSAELGQIIKKAIGGKGRIHPATKTFQALRIAVNGELESLEEFLKKAPSILKTGGKVAIISFHSLEDRIVKNFGRQWVRDGIMKEIVKKPITPGREEVLDNPRSRSAKLRVFEKIK